MKTCRCSWGSPAHGVSFNRPMRRGDRRREQAKIAEDAGATAVMALERVPALAEDPMRLMLQGKVLISELMQDLAAVALQVEGAHASLYVGDEAAPDDAIWPLAYMNSYGVTIAAGSSEIQRNILGERVLGMAKSK